MKTTTPSVMLGAWLTLALLPAMDAQTAPAIPTATETETKDQVVTLSPFEVVAETKGYFAANTMSGTRLNSRLEDIAAAIRSEEHTSELQSL